MTGRKKLPQSEQSGPEFVGKTPSDLAQAEVQARESGELPTREQATAWTEAAMHAGRVQAALVSATVAERIIAESYAKVMESKGYIGIPYVARDGSARHVASLDEFCEVFFGKSKRRCQELASNLEALGSALYESAEKIGLGQRDYNALKALPADDQVVIKQALAEGTDREGVVGMLASLAERQASELTDARADLDAKDQRITKLSEDLNKEHEKTTKAQRKWKSASPDERQVMLEQRVIAGEASIRAMLVSSKDSLSASVMELAAHCDENELDCKEFLGDLFGRLLNAVREVRDNEELPFPIDSVADGE